MKLRNLILVSIATVLVLDSCSEDEVVTPPPPPLPEPPPQYVLKWGTEGSGQGQFVDAMGIAVDKHGVVYVADRTNHRIQKFDGDGNFLLEWGSEGPGDGEFNYPEGIAVDTTDTIYVADTLNDRIQIFDPDGNFIRKWSVVFGPSAIAVDTHRDVYVEASFHSVVKFDAYGNHLVTWGGKSGTPPEDGKFNVVGGIAVDSSGKVYVTDGLNDRIQIFTGNGMFLMKWGSRGSGRGEFFGPDGIAVDTNDDVYVVQSALDRVEKFNEFGGFRTEWGSNGFDNGQFLGPQGIAIAGDGSIYVLDLGNDRVQKFQ